MTRWLGALLLVASAVAFADDFDGAEPLTLDQIAAIKADQDRAKKQITDKYKGDDTADRRQVKREIRDAMQAVLDDRGVDKNAYLKQLTHVSREDKEALETKSKAINDARDPPPPKPVDEWSTETPATPSKAEEPKAPAAAPTDPRAEPPEEPAGVREAPPGAPSDASPAGASPAGASPAGASPAGASPAGASPAGASDVVIIRGFDESHPVEVAVPEGKGGAEPSSPSP